MLSIPVITETHSAPTVLRKVKARTFVRKVRGGTQAHLLKANDGCHYVVKFKSNPQGRRTLINELIASAILRYLQLPSPRAALVHLSSDFLAENPEVHVQLASRRVAVEEGWHFGSCYPGHPDQVAAYDFLPDKLLEKVDTKSSFPGALVFDKWTGNTDSRQVLFVRGLLRQGLQSLANVNKQNGFLALLVDHGLIFDGSRWKFQDSSRQGLYFQRSVYGSITGWADFEPWLERVRNCPETVLSDCMADIPDEWLDGDRDSLSAVVEQLLQRRKRIADLVGNCLEESNLLPSWPKVPQSNHYASMQVC
jgi:hypothetical protein